MDTRIKPFPASFFISPQELLIRLAHSNVPLLLLDVRPQPRFDASPHTLEGAQRCSLVDVPALAVALRASNPSLEIVAYCVYGHHVSQEATAALRAAGLNARALAGGFEGGEDGADATQDIAEWRSVLLPKVTKEINSGTPNEAGAALFAIQAKASNDT